MLDILLTQAEPPLVTPSVDYKAVQWTYRAFPHDITANLWGYQYFRRGEMMDGVATGVKESPMAPMQDSAIAGGGPDVLVGSA